MNSASANSHLRALIGLKLGTEQHQLNSCLAPRKVGHLHGEPSRHSKLGTRMTEIYPLLKITHVTCASLTFAGFLLRAWWRWGESPLLQHPLTRVLPHLNDTLLLAAGLGMASILGQYPFEQPWLTAKLCGLLAYIALGTVAIKRGRTRHIRAMALAGALGAFAYLVAVALTRQPWPLA
jgi:uncharacterized membrane protein SirB2